ncbi:carbohydrate ABC transporter permease [Bacillus sp. ISL-40]|uniref:carbohydrate ABC transporter permease n=1 Tax=unclassified Bacillus (in: firmicutes) TaxID=185979 RepID=UPI001BEB1C86|nr:MULTISPECIES: carbohydrate ABC transporter permease [unclassified Bacillus (in: firmicutes)]MBT2700951.1 carbohydrate ABC transporter permease [Bacillus sp. ISL-40]MBT2720510.1 carbohydrate ABC transporter permease [Bacillus sp. ISL-46]MBT2742951.1 carbohydrate ABC transporter permease [Bacillus sp. ISL-77]
MYKSDRITQWVSHIFLIILAAGSIIPFIILLSSSLTDEAAIMKEGYSFIPKEMSFDAYNYLLNNSSSILRAYGITILVTVFGTFVSLAMTSFLAYALSRRDLPYKNVFAFLVFFTLLFNGGLVPTYLVYTQVFDIKNTIWALIVPGLLMNGFNVLLMRTFFMTSIPEPVIESARMDGAGEFRTFFSIILPLSLPILATIGLLQTIIYWNDWFNGLIYITEPSLFSIQNILNRMLSDIQFLASSNLGTNASQAASQVPTTGVRMAIAVIGVLPILIAYPFFQKYLVKGIALGSVKG